MSRTKREDQDWGYTEAARLGRDGKRTKHETEARRGLGKFYWAMRGKYTKQRASRMERREAKRAEQRARDEYTPGPFYGGRD